MIDIWCLQHTLRQASHILVLTLYYLVKTSLESLTALPCGFQFLCELSLWGSLWCNAASGLWDILLSLFLPFHSLSRRADCSNSKIFKSSWQYLSIFRFSGLKATELAYRLLRKHGQCISLPVPKTWPMILACSIHCWTVRQGQGCNLIVLRQGNSRCYLLLTSFQGSLQGSNGAHKLGFSPGCSFWLSPWTISAWWGNPIASLTRAKNEKIE